ncbi:MAG: magnesium transporter [Bacteroidales bacterium]|nr:magnesium transporter [Bacteroidales bacterium]MCF8389372.1 magnesium transporter [Bacteroidales bacterium]
MNIELTKEYIAELQKVISDKDEKLATEMLNKLHAADIAEIYSEIGTENAEFLFMLLEGEKASDVLAELGDDDRGKFLMAVSSETIATQFINEMDSDDAADVLADLSEEKKEEVLQFMEDIEQAGDIVDLLGYDEDTAGGLMAKEMIRVNENWTIQKALEEMRRQAEEVDEIFYVYVVDNANILKGTLSLKKLVLASPQERINKLYKPDVISVHTDTDDEEVANLMSKYDLVSLPVVDAIGRLVGRITIDDVIDVIQDEAEKDYQLASGITEDVEHSDSTWMLTRARLPWLMIGLFGGILVALVIGQFESDLQINPKMAFFIPLIAAMAGNVGIQSSAIVVQSIANNTLRLERTFPKLIKELSVGLLNGGILATMLFGYNYFFTNSLALTYTVSISLLIVILFAAFFGTLIPLILNNLKIDPALATGPFITTMNDIMGLFIYFLVGRILYGIF